MKRATVENDDARFEKMKRWLGDGEIDIDAMIRFGATTREKVIEICESLTDSPWHRQPSKTGGTG
jgi:hypothetical protein